MWKILEKTVRDELRKDCARLSLGKPLVLKGATGRIVYKLLHEFCLYKWEVPAEGRIWFWGHPVVLEEDVELNKVNYCGYVS